MEPALAGRLKISGPHPYQSINYEASPDLVPTLKTVVYTDFSDIPPNIWRACSYPQQPEFFLTIDWFKCLYNTSFTSNDELRAYFVIDTDEAVKAALFCTRRHGTRHLRSLTNFYSIHYSNIRTQEHFDSSAWVCLANFLADEAPGWHSLDLRYILPSDQTIGTLVHHLESRNYSFHRHPLYENWYQPTRGISFKHYYMSRPSRVRNTITRKSRKLRKQWQIEIRIFPSNEHTLEAGLSDYQTVYSRSWKQQEKFPEFIPELARTCNRLGILLIGVLYLDGQAAATQFWITTKPRAYIYKLAYAEEYAASSPGSILSEALFESVMEQCQPDEIDYGIGSESYKKDWMDEQRTLISCCGYNTRTFRGAALSVFEMLKTVLKPYVHRSEGI